MIHDIFYDFLQPFRVCRNFTGLTVLNRGLRFYLFLEIFGWLGELARDWIHGKQRVSPFYQALERYHFRFDPLFLESPCHLMLMS